LQKKGFGKEHAKFSPVCSVMYRFEPNIVLNQSKFSELTKIQKEQFVNSCPTKVYRLNEDTQIVEIEDPMKCMYCLECKKKGDDMGVPDLVKINQLTDRFMFTVETSGSLRPDEVFLLAVETLKKKLELLQNAVSESNN